MGNINLADLVQGAIQVRDEQTPKGNTNTRVGSLLLAIVEYIGNIEGQLRGDDIDELARQIQAEVTARQQADTNLSNQTNTSLNGINTLVINLQNALNKEVGTDRNVAINAAITTLHNELSTALGEKASKKELEAVNEALQKLDVGVTDIELQKMAVRTSAGELMFLTGITVSKGNEQKVLPLPEADATQSGLMTPAQVSGLEHAVKDSQVGTPNGLATLDSNGKLKEDQIPEKTNAIAGIYNVTLEVPLPDRVFYSLTDLEEQYSATAVAFANGKAKKGLILSFAVSATQWKTYQYTGSAIDKNAWCNADNWTDFGSLAAGSEGYIDINHVLGNTTRYTISSALEALKAYQQGSSICYDKLGMVIAFLADDGSVDTRQFKGEAVTDFFEASLWGAFGGGSSVETSDTPEKDGKDALSTGGAYKAIPAKLGVNTETPGVVKVVMLNADGEPVGDEEQFTVGTPGGGGDSGTIIAIQWKDNPLYEKAGGTFVAKASIISATKVGSMDNYNSIMKVQFVNRTTKKTVATFEPKKPSSGSNEDYSFEFDLSSLGTSAGEIPLQAVVTDDGGNTATKNLSLIAVDVTCVSVQTLNYTKDTSLEVSGNAKSIPMFKFPNNASDKGILTTVEIFKDGDWRQLQTVTVTDTYSHSVLIDPSGLSHGAYAIRIQGEDVSSGVKGNVLHTSVMVIQQDESLADYNTPIVCARWSDATGGKKKLLENIDIDVACFVRNITSPVVDIVLENNTRGTSETIGSKQINRSQTYTISKRLTSYAQGDMLKMRAKCGTSVQPEDCVNTIEGSLVDIAETEGALFGIDMAGRSNTDTNKRIVATTSDGDEVEIFVHGSNYSSNGFVKDSYGTSEYGTDNDKGRMALRIAEDVTATSNIKPYANASIETNGSAFSFITQVKNVADRNAVLMQCAGEKMGFVMTGEKLVVYTNGDTEDGKTSCTIPFSVNAIHRFDIVVEPTSIAPFGGIGMIKVFKDGDESGAVPYNAGQFGISEATVEWFGVEADTYLYYVKMWNTYYQFKQASDNWLVSLTDTELMIKEYEKNDVLVSQKAEGVTKDMPSMQKCLDAGLCVLVLTKNPDTPDVAENYPDHLESLDGDKKTTFLLDWYLYFPDRPWQNVIIEADPTSNQGTTSSMRPIKNKKAKHKKCRKMRMMYTREEIAAMFPGNAEVLAKYDKAAAQAAKNCIQVREGGQFTDISTVKVDFSDSCGAHNGAMMELMNDTQRALGEKYMTPAQVYNEGEFDIMTSIDSVPCALFRTDHQMNHADACDPAKAYFHAKANFNADKGDAKFFGFEKVKGYNYDCLNYGDFVEIVTKRDQTLAALKTEILAKSLTDENPLVAGTIYLLSEWCGDKYFFIENDGSGRMAEVDAVDKPTEIDKTLQEMIDGKVSDYDWGTVYQTSDGKYCQYKGGTWIDTTGEMTFNKQTKKWSVSGRVLNPVQNYEMLKYDNLNWMQGVNSVDDIMRIDETTKKPVWLSYYESRYPDDDDLNAKYESGEKVPYNLFKWLSFTQQCNHHLTEQDGDITINGQTVSGSREHRLEKWQKELHKNGNVHSSLCYTVASDYKACVDQRSKNAMIGFYLDIDGVVRMYMNHWYDGDCVDGSDNDCALTIPWDMNARTSHLYQGWDSVLFQQIYNAGNNGAFWLDDTGSKTVTLSQVAGDMRNVKYNNMKPFSASGCYYYWVTKRLEKWAKVISSFDGERKYVQNSKDADRYFYALHGLRLDDLPDYQRKRFEYCDGQYQVGDLYTNPFKARMMGPIEITITAAQDGFFGLGEDRADSCADSCFLHKGESYTMRVSDAQESGKMIYIFGASKLSKLDISKCTPKSDGFSLEYCTLLEELIVGGYNHAPAYTTGLLTGLSLPAMPFLRHIDIRNTKIAMLSAKNCPRLKEVFAEGSSLRTFTPAESAPLDTLYLPSTMTALQFVNLPRLTYPNGGLHIDGMSAVTRLELRGCSNIDTVALLNAICINSEARLKNISVDEVDVKGDAEVLIAIMEAKATGLGSDLSNVCDGITGRWMFNSFVNPKLLASLSEYFVALDIYNAQYTSIVMDDTVADPCNYSNEDNKTGYAYNNAFKASGHLSVIRDSLTPISGKYNPETDAFEAVAISRDDYGYLADGLTPFDNTDNSGTLNDVMMLFPHCWFKGVNDFKNQKKYTFWSSTDNEPLSSASRSNRKNLSECLFSANKAISIRDVQVGSTDINVEGTLVAAAGASTYKIDVEGMKQLRYPGMNSNDFGVMFTDAEGIAIGTFFMAVSHGYFDFVTGDYVFCDVPEGAVTAYFTSYNTVPGTEMVLATDSTEIEAIEPDWVENKQNWCVGVYQAWVDELYRLRSIAGKTPRTGTNTSTTASWNYDAEGNPTMMTLSTTVNYTVKDFMNMAQLRGKGYQMIDYEMSKFIAILFYSTVGNRDSSSVIGFGTSAALVSGYSDRIGIGNSERGQFSGNKALGLESILGVRSESMDYVGVNIASWETWKKNRCVDNISTDPINGIWHIYDPLTKTERTVQGLTSAGGQDICRVKHGRHCDVVPSKTTSDTSKYVEHYCDGTWYNASRGRVLFRSGSNAYANGCLVCASANVASSVSSANYGARLAFRGTIVLKDA